VGPVTTVFDANIVIDLLKGVEPALLEAESHDDRAISIVTWMEVMAGVTPELKDDVRGVLSEFRLISLSGAIAEQAVIERRQRRIKLPDAITIATAVVERGVLVTRNTKDFPRNERHVRIPYRLPVH